MVKQVVSPTLGRVISPGQRGKGRTSLNSTRAPSILQDVTRGWEMVGGGSRLALGEGSTCRQMQHWDLGGGEAKTILSEAFCPRLALENSGLFSTE